MRSIPATHNFNSDNVLEHVAQIQLLCMIHIRDEPTCIAVTTARTSPRQTYGTNQG